MIAAGPKAASARAPIGCNMVAMRADRVDAPTQRAEFNEPRPTCAGPTSAAAAIAAVELAPAISRRRGRWPPWHR